FTRYLNGAGDDCQGNDATVMSKASIGSVGRLMQLLKVVDARRQERERKYSQSGTSYLGTALPEQYELRQKTAYYKTRLQVSQVYNLLHRPRGWWAFLYHGLVFLLVFFCLILTVFSTDKDFEAISWDLMVNIETVMVVWFGLEFCIRMWASSCKCQYQSWQGKFRYIWNPLRIGDIVLIIVSIVLLRVGSADGHLVFAGFALRGFHRFFQVIQMIKSERRFRPASILMSVISAQREQLIITTYIGFIVLCFMAFLIYLVETDYNDYFDNIADSFWWAVRIVTSISPSIVKVITIFTIGYGDRVPVTWVGKLITCIFTILGVSIFALPAGIIGTGLAISVSEEQRVENRMRKKLPAAVLIQTCWRYYAANPTSLSIATWTIHKRHCDMISNDERNAIRFIRMTKFMLAKRDFESHRQQTDIRDVLAQYQTGHSSILYRIKEIQSDLSLIVGKVHTNGAKMLESRTGLVDRIGRLERMHRELDRKLDVNFELILSTLYGIQSGTVSQRQSMASEFSNGP
ncbi:unnamed protein product, partial [Oppiella nova]